MYIPLWLVTPESPRFHFLKNRVEEASQVLRKISKSKVLYQSPSEETDSIEEMIEKIEFEKNEKVEEFNGKR